MGAGLVLECSHADGSVSRSAPGHLVARGALFVTAFDAAAENAADKATARKLATDGIELYQAGKYPEALDRLERAEALFDAPVHLLYIARTQSALNVRVEAAETYRKLVRVKLDAARPRRSSKPSTTARRSSPNSSPRSRRSRSR